LKKFLAFIVLMFGAVSSSAAALEYDIYIAAGQSNMDGRGQVNDLDGVFAQPQAGTLIYYTNPADPDKAGEQEISSGWQTLAPGFSIPPGGRGDGLPAATFGPEVSFALEISEVTGTDRPIAIIKVSKGGTSLNADWSPTGFMYQSLLTEVEAATTALAEGGHTGTIRGMIWHQGESDGSRVDTYQAMLEELIGNVRTAFDNDALPFVIGELSPDKPASFRAMQRKIADENENVFFASSGGLNAPDETHFDAASQIEMGKRFAQALAPQTPEPSTGLLLFLGAAAMPRRKRRG
jgi:iduronate 2-sulfatase